MAGDSSGGDVFVVGSLNLDLVATADRLPAPGETVSGSSYAEHPGGKGLNQAIAAARAGAATQMLGAVGDDEAGRRLLDNARSAGVDTSSIAVIAGIPTGRALITVDASGENCIVVVPGANGLVSPADTAPSLSAQVPASGRPVLLTQLEIPIGTVVAALEDARRADVFTMLDPAPAADLPASALEVIDLIAPNEHEVELLGGVDRLLDAGVGAVLITLGGDGAELHRADEPLVRQRAFDVDVVDTTGAGDAFRGAFAARVAAGSSFEEALPFAAAAGALATTVAGAVPSLPMRTATDALLDLNAD